MKKLICALLSVTLLTNHALADGGGVGEYRNAGVPNEAAKLVGETRSSALVATGASSQTNGLVLKGSVNVFSTVTTGSADSCVLPVKSVALNRDDITVVNLGAGILQVYPPTGGAINANGTNASFPMPPGSEKIFKRISLTGWAAEGTVGSGSGYFDTTGLILPSGKGITDQPFTPVLIATPVAGTNFFAPGLNVIPTVAANAAAFLGSASTPIPGQEFIINNSGANAIRIKAAGGATLNGATAGGYISLASLATVICQTAAAGNQICMQPVIPTPAGP